MRVPPEAKWIGPAHPFDLHEAYVNFRRDVTLAHDPDSARVFITADSRYRLWINGEMAARGPSRGWPQAQQVDEIDITALLHRGANTIAVQIYSPGYSHFAYLHRGVCGLLGWLEVDGITVCASDQTWRAARDASWRDDGRRVSIYSSGVELRDMARDEAWQTQPADWPQARCVAPAESPLWNTLSPRDVPLLTETLMALNAPCAFRRGETPRVPDDPHEALRLIWGAALPQVPPTGDIAIAAGETCIWVFDLGYSRVCLGHAEIDNALGGEQLLISYAEKLRDGNVLLSDPQTYCRMRLTDAFTLRPGQQSAEGFSARGGRYLIFAVTAVQTVSLHIHFSARCFDYPQGQLHALDVADPALAKIAAMCRTTTLACLQDGFVDSVWRESSQWLGDGVAQAFALAAISDDLRPLRRLITMAAQGAYDDGILPGVLPGEAHAYAVTDYNLSFIELLEAYVDRPAAADGEELLLKMLAVVERMMFRFSKDLGADGLLRSQPGRRLFLDWSAVERREPNLTYNSRFLHGLRTAARLAARAGRRISAEHFRHRAEQLQAAVTDVFNVGEAWHESPGGAPASQLGLALLLLTDTVHVSRAAAMADAIVARSLDLDDGASPGKLVLASPFMHHYVFLALHHLGRDADILAIIRARWGRWANAGEPTCWENWAIDFPDGSACHGFSAHPLGWIARLASHHAG